VLKYTPSGNEIEVVPKFVKVHLGPVWILDE
jgi:hypothetical protein